MFMRIEDVNTAATASANHNLTTVGYSEPFFGDIWDWDLDWNPRDLHFEPNKDCLDA
jgi:hypothetical protein